MKISLFFLLTGVLMMSEAQAYSFDAIELPLYNERLRYVEAVPIPPATEEKVQAFERLIGAPLPDDYRRFLKTVNGGGTMVSGEPDYLCYTVKWGEVRFDFLPPEGEYGLSVLFTLDPEFVFRARKEKDFWDVEYISLEHKYKDYLDLEDMGYPHIPKGLLPIGDTPVESDLIMLGLEGERRGKVYYLMLQDDAQRPGENLGFVANSFEEFLQSLHRCE